MRTICDVCESSAAILFCAADEAALCRSCDEKVHMCNKLASRHVRVGLADPSAVPQCDICENAPAFFYCEIDGSSLCLQCDMIVHVGGKRTHGRYLLLRQRVEFPGDKPGRMEEQGQQPLDQNETRRDQNQPLKLTARENQQNHRASPVPMVENNTDSYGKMDSKLIDLNARPQRIHGQNSNNQENYESSSAVPVGSFNREPAKQARQSCKILASLWRLEWQAFILLVRFVYYRREKLQLMLKRNVIDSIQVILDSC